MRRFPKDPSVLWNMKQGIQYLNMKIDHMLVTALELECDPSKEGLDVDVTMWSRAGKRLDALTRADESGLPDQKSQ